MKVIIGALLIVFLSGCNYERGECVYIEILNTGAVDTFRAEYLKFDDGAHWYKVDGKVGAVFGGSSFVTRCQD